MDECIHGLVGCATCLGIPEDDVPNTGISKRAFPWSDQDITLARDTSLTSGQVAERIGRNSSQVAAYRVAQLRMTEWAGNNHRS